MGLAAEGVMLVTCTTGLDIYQSVELVLLLSNHLHTYFTTESDQSGNIREGINEDKIKYLIFYFVLI